MLSAMSLKTQKCLYLKFGGVRVNWSWRREDKMGGGVGGDRKLRDFTALLDIVAFFSA